MARQKKTTRAEGLFLCGCDGPRCSVCNPVRTDAERLARLDAAIAADHTCPAWMRAEIAAKHDMAACTDDDCALCDAQMTAREQRMA